MAEYKRDEWSLDDGVQVGVVHISAECDLQGDWYIAHAEFENGDEATDSELRQLQDMNPEKFAGLVFETIEGDAEARFTAYFDLCGATLDGLTDEQRKAITERPIAEVFNEQTVEYAEKDPFPFRR